MPSSSLILNPCKAPLTTAMPAPVVTSAPFHQLSPDRSNQVPRDHFGHAVTFAADGQTLAISAPYHNFPSFSSGLVQIYARQADDWIPIGAPLTGTIPLEFFGWSIALTADGTAIAIGSTGGMSQGQRCGNVQLYRRQIDRWVAIGPPIAGESPDELAGSAIALSADGQYLAIGAALNDTNGSNSGKVKVYRQPDQPDQPWQQIGGDLWGDGANNYFGSAIALSADGQHLAIGAPYCAQEHGPQCGAVILYQQVAQQWQPVGRLVGRGSHERFGAAVALTADGQTIAIGVTGAAANRGAIRVYYKINDFWTQRGEDLPGLYPGEGFGDAIGLSADGHTVTGSTTAAFTPDHAPSHVRTYQYQANTWLPVGDIASSSGRFGHAFALSPNGQTLAIGAPGHDQNLTDCGCVRLFARLQPIAQAQIQRHPDNLTLQMHQGAHTAPVTLTYGFGGRAGQPMELDRNWAIIDTRSAHMGGADRATIDVLLHSRRRDEVCRWQVDQTGQIIAIQLLQTPSGQILRTGNPHWRLIGWAAFGQGTPLDLFWHNPVSDEMAFWSLAADRFTVTGYDYLYDRQGFRIKTGNSGWEICAIADLDGNGQPDLLLRLPALNQTAVIRLDGKIFVQAQYLTSPPIANLQYRDIWFWADHSLNLIHWQDATQTQVIQQSLRFHEGRFVADQFIPLDAPWA
jgi:hypothetical protein